MQIYRKASLRAGGASHSSRTFGKSLEVMISPSRLNDDSCSLYDLSYTFLPERHRQSLVLRPVVTLVRLLDRALPYHVAPATGESFGADICPVPCSLCHLMPSHTPISPWSSSKCRSTPSTNHVNVFKFNVGRFVWLNKDYCLTTSSCSKIFRQGGNA